MSLDEQNFLNPPPAFNGQPLWHMNGTLCKSEIERQLRDARYRSNFGGAAILPVRETEPPYMSESYFDFYRHILDTCRALDMSVILYDDIGFPSGTAGGRLKQLHPEHIRYALDIASEEVHGPAFWTRHLPAGRLMSAVAMNSETYERREMTVDTDKQQVSWNVPNGRWKVMIFTAVQDESNFVNYLSSAAVDAFISLTYEEYYRRFPEHFGTTIKTTFFDDVNLRRPDCRVWTPDFNELFESETGTSPSLLYPALWFNIGPDTDSARVSLFSFRAKLFSEAFTQRIRKWTSAHGVQCSGHAMEEYAEQPTFLAGDNILFYKHSDIPMIDSIHYYGRGRPGFKFTSSAAWTYDKPLTAVEIYGNYRERLDRDMMYRSGMELFARGANVFLPHGMWYDPNNVGIKPLISEYNPDISADLHQYNEWVGRCSLMLRGGRAVTDIGVLYPITALQAHSTFAALLDQRNTPGSVHPNSYTPPECDLYMLSDSLTGGARRDFTFLHPEILDNQCIVEGNVLKLKNEINFQEYRVVIIPGCRVIHVSSLLKLKAFYDAGGKVAATTALPSKSAEHGHDTEVSDIILNLFGISPDQAAQLQETHTNVNSRGGTACFIPSFIQNRQVLTQCLDKLLPDGDVRFSNVPATIDPTMGMFSYLHRNKDGKNIYFLANSTDNPIKTTMNLRGRMSLELWNPHSGSHEKLTADILTEPGAFVTAASIAINPLQSVFVVAQQC